MHPHATLMRLTAAALAASAIFAGAADAAPRDFTLDLSEGALAIESIGNSLTERVTIAGSVDDGGAVTVRAAGMTFPRITTEEFAAQIVPLADATGVFDDATGLMTLNTRLRLELSSVPGGNLTIPQGCAVGNAADPIRVALKTTGGTVAGKTGSITGAAFSRAAGGAIALTDAALVPPAQGEPACGGIADYVLALRLGLGLKGKLSIPEKQAPPVNGGGGGGTTPGTQVPATQPPSTSTVPTPPPAPVLSGAPSLARKLTKLTLTAPAQQKGLKSGGTVLGVEVDQPATAVLNATVKVGGKTTKLAALRRTLQTGRASVAVSFPAALRRQVQRALKSRKSVAVTIAVTATDTSGTKLTRSRQIRLTR